MMLAIGTSLACCRVTLHIRNYHIDVNYQLSLEWGSGLSESGTEPTERTLKI